MKKNMPLIIGLCILLAFGAIKLFPLNDQKTNYSKKIEERCLYLMNSRGHEVSYEKCHLIGISCEDNTEYPDRLYFHVNCLLLDNEGNLYYLNNISRMRDKSFSEDYWYKEEYVGLATYNAIANNDIVSVTCLKVDSVKRFCNAMTQHLPEMEGYKIKSNFVYSVSDLHFDEEKHRIEFNIWQNAIYYKNWKDKVQYKSKNHITMYCTEEEFSDLRNDKQKILLRFIDYAETGLYGEKYRLVRTYQTTEIPPYDDAIFNFKKLPLKFR